MEQLRKAGQVCRQHYEKLLLSIALLLLGVAVLYLFNASKTEAENIRKIPLDFERRTVSTVKPVELTNHLAALKQAESPLAFNFSPPHHLFNPVRWQILPGATTATKDTTGEETGPKAMLISGPRPYSLRIGYGGVASSGTDAQLVVSGYWIGVTNEAVLRNTGTEKRFDKLLLPLNVTNRFSPVVLTEVKGSPQAPEAVTGMLRESGEKFSFGPDVAYQKIIGYETRLQYPNSTNFVENGAYLRTGRKVDINGQIYKIVDISTNEVKVVADSNEKPYSITKVAP